MDILNVKSSFISFSSSLHKEYDKDCSFLILLVTALCRKITLHSRFLNIRQTRNKKLTQHANAS